MEDFKIEVGDLVKLRDDLIEHELYGDKFFKPYMRFEGFKKLDGIDCYDNSLLIHDLHYTKEMIAEVKRPTQYETIYKREKPILDDKEKEYLSNLIRPFKNKVKHIAKRRVDESQYIIIILARDEDIYLPYFKKDTMYKNMKLEKEYTLEELGL